MIDDCWWLLMIDDDRCWLMMIDDYWWWLLLLFLLVLQLLVLSLFLVVTILVKKGSMSILYFFMKYKPSQPIGNHPLWPCPFRIVNHFVRSYSMWKIPQHSVAFWRIWVLSWTLFSRPRLVYYINPHWDPDSGYNGGGLDVRDPRDPLDRWVDRRGPRRRVDVCCI